MFNKKLKARVTKLEDKIDGYEYFYREGRSVGIIEKLMDLKKENEKLKAIVAEICDYVYRENK